MKIKSILLFVFVCMILPVLCGCFYDYTDWKKVEIPTQSEYKGTIKIPNNYEFVDEDGNFIRKTNYKTPGPVYSYYLNDNLVIYVLRKHLHIVLDYNNEIIETFETDKINRGYYTSADFNENISFSKNGYDYYYSNANWFQRRVQKESYIFVTYNEEIILKIDEKIDTYTDFIPIVIILLWCTVATIILIIKRKKRI